MAGPYISTSNMKLWKINATADFIGCKTEMQNEYEVFCKICCYLNIENEAVKNEKEKDRQQVKLTFTYLIFTANILILFTDLTASKKWSGLSDSRLSTNFF